MLDRGNKNACLQREYQKTTRLAHDDNEEEEEDEDDIKKKQKKNQSPMFLIVGRAENL